jgi:NADPH-dependent F420 reductase
MTAPSTPVAIVGGTGGLGRGLAARWVAAGIDVVLGSRDPQRAAEAAAKVGGALDDAGVDADARGSLSAGGNAEVVGDAEVVVMAVPHGGLDEAFDAVGAQLAGRIVLSVVNPLTFDDTGPVPVEVPEGSAAARIAAALPEARVVAGLHSVSSRQLLRLGEPLDDDVPLVGDDEDALAAVAALVDRIDGCRAVVAGPLRLARPLEELTCVLLSVNRRHRVHTGLRLTRL